LRYDGFFIKLFFKRKKTLTEALNILIFDVFLINPEKKLGFYSSIKRKKSNIVL
jgi:hypothetical protein